MRFALCFMVSAAAAALTTSASSFADADRQFTRVSGPGVRAVFRAEDPSRDIVTDVVVIAFGPARAQYSPGAPQETAPALGVSIVRRRQSNDEPLLSVAGFTDAFDLQLAPDRRTSTLVAQLVAQDVSGTTYVLPVELRWTATGPERRFHSQAHTVSPGAVNLAQASGTERPAIAAGRVEFEGENMTPQETPDAQILTYASGFIGIQHTRPPARTAPGLHLSPESR